MSCFWSHKWSKWTEAVNVEGTRNTLRGKSVDVTVAIQQRTCEKCGETEVKHTLPLA